MSPPCWAPEVEGARSAAASLSRPPSRLRVTPGAGGQLPRSFQALGAADHPASGHRLTTKILGPASGQGHKAGQIQPINFHISGEECKGCLRTNSGRRAISEQPGQSAEAPGSIAGASRVLPSPCPMADVQQRPWWWFQQKLLHPEQAWRPSPGNQSSLGKSGSGPALPPALAGLGSGADAKFCQQWTQTLWGMEDRGRGRGARDGG
eukprot:bmy_15617T0